MKPDLQPVCEDMEQITETHHWG